MQQNTTQLDFYNFPDWSESSTTVNYRRTLCSLDLYKRSSILLLWSGRLIILLHTLIQVVGLHCRDNFVELLSNQFKVWQKNLQKRNCFLTQRGQSNGIKSYLPLEVHCISEESLMFAINNVSSQQPAMQR